MMTSGKTHEHQQGFTLLELIISMFILTVGLLAVASMHVTAITVNTAARNVTESTMLAQSKIEELMNLSYSHDDLNAGNHEEEAEDIPARFDTLTWNVADDPGGISNMKRINITVTWHEGRVEKTTKVTCIRSQKL